MRDRTTAGELDDLEIAIDRDAEVPIGVQLAWALRARIRDGSLEPGQRLPGLRELAEATGVNANTVRAVYQGLDREGLIDTLQGRGTFVAPTRREPTGVATIAANAAEEAHKTGVDLREVAAALYMLPPPPRQPADEEAKRRRVLREEIAILERAISGLESQHPGVAPASSGARAARGPAVLSTRQLEDVRTQLVRRLAAAQRAVDELLEAPEKPTSPAREKGKAGARASVKPKPAPSARPARRPATAGA
jgi:DNA-binding transcriptional regulator YhcF (GntR family)